MAVDSGNFMGYPSAYLAVPDELGFCFTQAFQSIGLGLATAIGAALARPDRLTVAALGDGGALMGAAELETVGPAGLAAARRGLQRRRLRRRGAPLRPATARRSTPSASPTPTSPRSARGYGFEAVTVREPGRPRRRSVTGSPDRAPTPAAGGREGRRRPRRPGGSRRPSAGTDDQHDQGRRADAVAIHAW